MACLDFSTLAREMGKLSEIIVIGPMPPPIGGTRVSFEILYRDLESTFPNVRLVDLTYNPTWYRKLISEVSIILHLILRLPKTDVIFLNADTKRFLTLGTFLSLIARITNRKLVYRCFGADFDIHYRRNKIIRFLMKHIFREARIVYLQTKGLVEFYKENIGKNIQQLPTSRHFVSQDNKKFRKVRSKSVKIRFLFAGHISVNKGVLEIIEAVKIINNNGVDNWDFTMIGDIKDIEIGDFGQTGIKIKSQMSHRDLQCEFSNYDVLVFPSFHQGEGYPGVLIEAMSHGLAIICSEWRYLAELIDDNGLMVPIQNSSAISDAMQKYIDSNELLSRHQRQSLANAEKFLAESWNHKVGEDIKTLCVG